MNWYKKIAQMTLVEEDTEVTNKKYYAPKKDFKNDIHFNPRMKELENIISSQNQVELKNNVNHEETIVIKNLGDKVKLERYSYGKLSFDKDFNSIHELFIQIYPLGVFSHRWTWV